MHVSINDTKITYITTFFFPQQVQESNFNITRVYISSHSGCRRKSTTSEYVTSSAPVASVCLSLDEGVTFLDDLGLTSE